MINHSGWSLCLQLHAACRESALPQTAVKLLESHRDLLANEGELPQELKIGLIFDQNLSKVAQLQENNLGLQPFQRKLPVGRLKGHFRKTIAAFCF